MVSAIVEDDVAFGPENLGVDPKEIRQRVDQALEAVNMGQFKNKAPHLFVRADRSSGSPSQALLQ